VIAFHRSFVAMGARSFKVVLCSSLASVLQAQTLLPFESFIELHSREYERGSAEFEERRALYEERIAKAKIQNSLVDRLWNAGVNKLWDWTDAELQTLRGWDGSARPAGGGNMRAAHRHSMFLQQKVKELPKEKIWGNLTMAANVKDQRSCGSCWAIATASTLEAHVEIFSGKHRSFSAQQIVSCTPNPRHCGGEGGCRGATAELGMEWVLKNGCAEEKDIPYRGVDGVCSEGAPSQDVAGLKALGEETTKSVSKSGADFGMTGWETLPKNKYEPLVQALLNSGPVAVSVAADRWFAYHNGIFNGCDKDAVISHAVVALGFGQDTSGHKYWVIQNSWGRDWGENGHIRLERHDGDEYCGMNNDPQKGVACKGETEPVPVCGMCGVLFDSVVPHFG
jgi:cathepsin L